jgi:hypothetical protein
MKRKVSGGDGDAYARAFDGRPERFAVTTPMIRGVASISIWLCVFVP